jgi:four helix bundle protein
MQTIPDRTFKFGVKIVELVTKLPRSASGFAISSQIVRSGTSVGANVEEAQNAGSKKEFIRSMTIALKEARETHYWLRIIKESGLVKISLESLIGENLEIIKILTSSVKKAKTRV